MSDLKDRLIGTWRLRSAELRDSAGKTHKIFGSAPISNLFYTEEGFVSLHVMPGGEFDPGHGPLPDPPISVYSYCGLFRVEDDRVYHDISISMNPGWVGATLMRHISFSGDDLILSTDESYIEDREGTITLVWLRVGNSTQVPNSAPKRAGGSL